MAVSSSSTSRSSSASSCIQEAACLNRNSPKYMLEEVSGTFSIVSATVPRPRRRNSAGLMARLRSKLCFCHSDLAEDDLDSDRKKSAPMGCCNWMYNNSTNAHDLRVIHVCKMPEISSTGSHGGSGSRGGSHTGGGSHGGSHGGEGSHRGGGSHAGGGAERSGCLCGKSSAGKTDETRHHGGALSCRDRRLTHRDDQAFSTSATMVHRSCTRGSAGQRSATLGRPTQKKSAYEHLNRGAATLDKSYKKSSCGRSVREEGAQGGGDTPPSSCSSSSLLESVMMGGEACRAAAIDSDTEETLFQLSTADARTPLMSTASQGTSDLNASYKVDSNCRSSRTNSKNSKCILLSEGSRNCDSLRKRSREREISIVSDDSEDEIYESYETTKPEPKVLLSSEALNGEHGVLAVYDQVKDVAVPGWSLSGELAKLSRHGWYWGPITRVEAEEKLAGQPDGTFLVRDSSDDHYLLSLSFRSYSRTLHTRIEHCNGVFSLYTQQAGGIGGETAEGYASIVELIERSVSDSQTGIFCYSRARAVGSPSFPVRLTRPVSRFSHVRSLQYLCRFVIRQRTRVDHIQKLPLPGAIKGFLEERQY